MIQSISTKSYRLFLHITLPILFFFAISVAGLSVWAAILYSVESPYEEPDFPFRSLAILYCFTGFLSGLWSVVIFILSFVKNPNPIKGQYFTPRDGFLAKLISPLSVTFQSLILWILWTTSTIMQTIRQTKQCVYAGSDYSCISDVTILLVGWIGWGFLTTCLGFFIAYTVASRRESREVNRAEFLDLEGGSTNVSSEEQKSQV